MTGPHDALPSLAAPHPSGAITPPGAYLIPRPSWGERNKTLIGSVGAVTVSLIAALSGHLVELLKLLLDRGWSAVLLVGAVLLVALVFRLFASLQEAVAPVVRTLASLAEHSGQVDTAHQQQISVLLKLSGSVDQLALTVNRLDQAVGLPTLKTNPNARLPEPWPPAPTPPAGRVSRPPPPPQGESTVMGRVPSDEEDRRG